MTAQEMENIFTEVGHSLAVEHMATTKQYHRKFPTCRRAGIQLATTKVRNTRLQEG